MPAMSALEIIAITLAAGVACVAANTLLSVLAFRPPRPGPLPHPVPLLSILVPARDEARRIGPCLASLSAQTWPNLEILVLNDESTDGTDAVVREHAARDPRVRLLPGKPLPEGWTGKCWAVHQLAQAARGGYLLFTDADTRHQPGAAAAAIGGMESRRAGLACLWPWQETGTLGERLTIPFVYLLLLGFRPHWMEPFLRNPILGAGNGQFLLARADAYRAAGGHEAVRHHLVEDIALARHMLARGHRVANFDGSEHVACRMYERFSEVWSGFTKNLRAAFDDQLLAFLGFGFVQFGFFFGPFALLPVALAQRDFPAARWALAAIAAIYALRLFLAWRFRSTVAGALLHPLGQLLAIVIGLNSWFRLHTTGVEWKGRTYRQ